MTDSRRPDPYHPAPTPTDPARPLPSDPTIPFVPVASDPNPSPPDDPASAPWEPAYAWDVESADLPSDSAITTDDGPPDPVPSDAGGQAFDHSPPDSGSALAADPEITGSGPEESGSPQGSPPSEPAAKPGRFGRGRMPASRLPGGRLGRVRDPRIWIAVAGAVAVLLALLASEAGLAIMLATAVIPLAIIVTLDRVDVFDREPALILLGIGTAGAAAGVLIGLLNGFLLDEFWEETTVDRIGVIGLAGELAGRGDTPPVAIYALAGIVVPALAVAAMLAAPVAARRWPAFRNEAMDGVTLAAAAAGGFTLGTALVHLWPLISGDTVAGSVADWTVAVLSIVVFRPVIVMAIAALVGLAIWQFDLSRSTRDLVVPLAAGLGGAIAYALLGLLAEQSGAVVQLICSLAVAAILLAAGRNSLQSAIAFDRRLLAGNRVVCPNCRRVTPAGKFCAFCQHPLPTDATH